MPFKLPQDKNAPRIVSASSTENSPDPILAAQIAELRPAILQASAAESAAADAFLETDPDAVFLRGTGRALREAWQTFARETKASENDRALSAEGKRAAWDQSAARRDAAIQRIADAVLDTAGDRLLAKNPAPNFGTPPTVEMSSAASLIYASYPSKTAASLMTEALANLRRAIDPVQLPAMRYFANQQLSLAYLPLMRRRADSPENFAVSLAGLADDLADLIETHLDTVLHDERYENTVEYVASVRADFVWCNNQAKELNRWDSAIEIGAAQFFASAPVAPVDA